MSSLDVRPPSTATAPATPSGGGGGALWHYDGDWPPLSHVAGTRLPQQIHRQLSAATCPVWLVDPTTTHAALRLPAAAFSRMMELVDHAHALLADTPHRPFVRNGAPHYCLNVLPPVEQCELIGLYAKLTRIRPGRGTVPYMWNRSLK